jgi:hypothetical protein
VFDCTVHTGTGDASQMIDHIAASFTIVSRLILPA